MLSDLLPILALRHWPRACVLASLGAVLGMPAAQAETRVIDNPGQGHNRIEVSNNSAHDVQLRCADGRTAQVGAGVNVNSVNIDSRVLQGRTVIVTGRNSRDVRAAADCGAGQAPAANVNSINIQ